MHGSVHDMNKKMLRLGLRENYEQKAVHNKTISPLTLVRTLNKFLSTWNNHKQTLHRTKCTQLIGARH